MYHRFGDARFPSTNISLEDFEAHLKWLRDQQYQVVTLSGAIEYLGANMPVQKTAVITVDDAYKSFYANALPLLKQYNMPATLFVNTETVGGSDYMGWDELGAVAEAGIEIGNHTHSHDYFLNKPKPDRYRSFDDELKQSQALIETHLAITPKVFAYPYGEFDERMKTIVRENGFIAAAAQYSGVLNSGSDLYQIPRFPMSEAYSELNQFAEKARMRSLPVIEESPFGFILPNAQPVLSLTVRKADLQIDRLQCFVQGGACEISVSDQSDSTYMLTLQAKASLSSRRRTLYTVTVPDSRNEWYWHSHLWINREVK